MIKTIETSSTWDGGQITSDMYDELQQGFLTSAEQIANRSRQLVPVGEGDPKHLRDTIRAKGKRKETRFEGFIRGLATGNYEQSLPGAFVFYGDRDAGVYWQHFVEFGTYDKPAHPYIRPAVDASFDAVLAEANRAGQRALNKRRRARRARRRREAAA